MDVPFSLMTFIIYVHFHVHGPYVSFNLKFLVKKWEGVKWYILHVPSLPFDLHMFYIYISVVTSAYGIII